MNEPIRALIVDDSAFMRKSLSIILDSDPDITIVGTAKDGYDCVKQAKELKPDIITLDVEMPRMDGLQALKIIMRECPTSVIMVSSLTTEGAESTIKALELGAVWAGKTEDRAPQKLDAVIDTTPAWKPVVEALRNLKSGGRLVINAIRKETADKDYLLQLDYVDHLWMEKEIKSVANVAGRDIREFLQLAGDIPIKPEIQEYALEEANRALLELKERKIRGAKVLVIQEP